MHRYLAILIALVAFGCVSRAPKETLAEDRADAADDPSIGIVAGKVSITSQAETGEKHWRIDADRADAMLKTGNLITGLEGVTVTLFQKDSPFLTVRADRGEANEAERRFMLDGNVQAKSSDSRASISAHSVANTPREGEIEAKDDVRARVDNFSIERAFTARAFFADIGSRAATLQTIFLQGDDVWFRSSDGDLVISGVTEGEMEFQNENRDVRFKLRGSPVKMVWKQHRLTVIGQSLDATARRSGERYLLSAGTFTGGVRIEMAGTESGAQWTATAAAPSATYDGGNAELRMTGGVRATSKHPSVAGVLTAPVVAMRFDRTKLASSGAFDPVSISASGGGVRFEDERSDVLITDLSRITVSRGAAKDRTKFEGQGAPFRLRQPRTGGAETISISAREFEGEAGPGIEDGRETYVLQRLVCTRGIDAMITGALPPERRTATNTTWSVEGTCESLDYNRSNSTMILSGVRELNARHPDIISGAGTIYSPRVDITFRENTYQPRKIAFSKGTSA